MSIPRKLLVVDDEQKLCKVLTQYFSLKGYEVQSVHRGEDALTLVPSFHPDVVILDMLMPGMSGLDTLKQLKQSSPSSKIVILSASDREERFQEAIKVGADAYLCKPADLAQLEALLEKVLS